MKEYEWKEKNGERHIVRIKSVSTKDLIAQAKTYKYSTLKMMIDQKLNDVRAKLNDAKKEKEINSVKVRAYTAQLARLEKYAPIALAQAKGAPATKKTTAKTKLPSNKMLNKCAFK